MRSEPQPMAVAYETPEPGEPRPSVDGGLRVVRDPNAGADALRHLAAEVSGQLDLQTLLTTVVGDGMRLFGLTRMGVWLYHADRRQPLSLAAQRGLPDEVLRWVTSLSADDQAAGI